MLSRKIIHIDMDAFYASIEQRDFPELQGKPVAVGWAASRGVVAAASYEARKYGVRSAMPSVVALRKCPHLIFQPHRFHVYKSVSAQIRDIFREYTDLVEPLSLDEAYLDVSSNKKNIASATHIALEIKQRIREATQLTASAGVSYNKFLAKMASDVNKPDGLFVIKPHQAVGFLKALDVGKLYGIGEVTAEKLRKMGIHTGGDLQALTLDAMIKIFGKKGLFFYDIVRGTDRREVEPERIRKSLSVENTFETDLTSRFSVITELYHLEKRLFEQMQRLQQTARTVTLKVRFNDFQTITRSRTLNTLIDNYPLLQQTSRSLLNEVSLEGKGIRLLGIGLSNLHDPNESRQLELDLIWPVDPKY
ncbi:MAG: DNA polymerase IV [Bacteroidales bacterium]|jgi:DNA polymerase-4|nr:DNA polymerase IV [Bacteroidales bacterium]